MQPLRSENVTDVDPSSHPFLAAECPANPLSSFSPCSGEGGTLGGLYCFLLGHIRQKSNRSCSWDGPAESLSTAWQSVLTELPKMQTLILLTCLYGQNAPLKGWWEPRTERGPVL